MYNSWVCRVHCVKVCTVYLSRCVWVRCGVDVSWPLLKGPGSGWSVNIYTGPRSDLSPASINTTFPFGSRINRVTGSGRPAVRDHSSAPFQLVSVRLSVTVLYKECASVCYCALQRVSVCICFCALQRVCVYIFYCVVRLCENMLMYSCV